MPCDNHSHSLWPPEGSVKASYHTIQDCETICGYCIVPRITPGVRRLRRSRFPTAKGQRHHIARSHRSFDSDACKEIQALQDVKQRFGILLYDPLTATIYRTPEEAKTNLNAPQRMLWICEDRRGAFKALMLNKSISTRDIKEKDMLAYSHLGLLIREYVMALYNLMIMNEHDEKVVTSQEDQGAMDYVGNKSEKELLAEVISGRQVAKPQE